MDGLLGAAMKAAVSSENPLSSVRWAVIAAILADGTVFPHLYFRPETEGPGEGEVFVDNLKEDSVVAETMVGLARVVQLESSPFPLP